MTKKLLGTIAMLLSSSIFAANNYVETNGSVVIEAEDFSAQYKDGLRRWLVFSSNSKTHNYPDSDKEHSTNASQGTYIELLPDTRTNHNEAIVHEENFTSKAGSIAVLTYPVYFNTPGIYYVWARAYSTGSEDNGVHIGLNNKWPESAKRLQLCKNKHQWTWSSAQRTKKNHCGVPNTITLTIPSEGIHNVMVSMREDGFELDKLLLTTDSSYQPKGVDLSATKSPQTPLLEKQTLLGIKQYKKILYAHKDFSYKIQKNLASTLDSNVQTPLINSETEENSNKYVYAQYKIGKKEAGLRQLTLVALAENTSNSMYQVWLNNEIIGEFKKTKANTEQEEVYFIIPELELKKGDVLTVADMAISYSNQQQNSNELSTTNWRALVIGT